jgi:hypothetical protein
MRINRRTGGRIALVLLGVASALGQAPVPAAETRPGTQPAGEEKSAKTRTLEAGARALQRNSPLGPMDIYLVGFHPMKDHPDQQMEAHHYCRQVNEDFAQCALFDGNTRNANLNGIEYIISERLFESLPQEERTYWHPHNYEILSGQLIAPGLPRPAEEALMKSKMNSYGKTWHVWHTGMPGEKGDKLPMGPAQLAWSFNRDGEVQPGLVEQRDKRFRMSSAEKRRERAGLAQIAKPQSGVDDLKDAFKARTQQIPGVVDQRAAKPAGKE